MSMTYRAGSVRFNLLALMVGIIFLIFLGCSSGGGGGGGGGGDETILAASDIADTWQFNVDHNILADGESGNYLNFSIIDQELMIVSVYEGAVVSNPVDLVRSELYFKYQEGEKDWDLIGTVNGDSITGTWQDNFSESSGTWRAEKMLPQESLTPGFYSTGDVVMDLTLEGNAAVAEFYGSIPQGDDEPVFTGYTITTEEEELEIVLNEKEQITGSILGDMELELTHNNDGTFNYELYTDGLLTYSASNLSYETTAVNVLSQSNIHAASKKPKNLQIQKDAQTIGVNAVNSTFKEEYIGMKIYFRRTRLADLYHDLDREKLKVKSGFFSYVQQNEEFNNSLNKLAIITVLHRYHQEKIKKECVNSVDQRKCKAYGDKVEKIWFNYLIVLSEYFNNLIVQLHDEYEGPLCIDNDEDKFKSHENCGTKLDCDDNNRAMYPGNKEICNDGYDNDCDGQKDCDDPACADNAACTPTTSDCSEEYEINHELEMTLNRYCGFGSAGGLICSRYGFSGCANACVTASHGAGSVFNASTCSSYPGYASCASGAFNTYIACLEKCNADFLNGEWGTKLGEERYILENVCAPQCEEDISHILDTQCSNQ